MQLTPVVKTILIINIVFFGIQLICETMMGGDWFGGLNALYPIGDPRLLPHQYLTYMFIHGGWWHLFFNMWQLIIFGAAIEQTYGWRRFLIYYILCGVGSALANQGCELLGLIPAVPVVGASGAIYGVMVAAAFNFPNVRMFIIPFPFPIKLKWLVAGFAAYDLFSGVQGGDGVAHFAHLGGLVVGLLILFYWKYKDSHRTSSNGNYWTSSNSYSNYDKGEDSFFGKLKSRFAGKKKPKMTVTMNHDRASDYEYNAEKKARSEEIDRILDKVRKGGFANLTEDEKKTLFDASKR